MSKEKSCNIHKTSIGGQAVIEGVMMKGPGKIATAVRKPDGEIIIDEKECGKVRKSKILKAPIIRGCINFFDSMIVGVQALMYSAKFFDIEEDEKTGKEKESKFEKWLEEKLGSEKALNAVIYFSVILSLFMSVGLFILLPTVIVGFLKGLTENHIILTLAEGVVRMSIFLIYLALVARMEDIKRVFMYHGAEHKTIFCYEKGLPLTVENVRAQRRFHPRCGTSFMVLMLIVGIFVSMFIPPNLPTLLRTAIKLLTLPVVVGVGYELIKLAGRVDNWLTRAISAPGTWMQHLTVLEPDDAMIECAIAAFVEVLPEDEKKAEW